MNQRMNEWNGMNLEIKTLSYDGGTKNKEQKKRQYSVNENFLRAPCILKSEYTFCLSKQNKKC